MTQSMNFRCCGTFGFLLLVAVVAGCSQESAANAVAAPESVPAAETHSHLPGQHGGLIVSVGHDEYHAEPVFQSDGSLRLYMLGQDESRVLEIEVQTIAAYISKENLFQSVAVELKPAPQRDDAPNKTSVFVGNLPEEMRKSALTVVIPSIRISGIRFRFAFHSGDEGRSQMPRSASAQAGARALPDAERSLHRRGHRGQRLDDRRREISRISFSPRFQPQARGLDLPHHADEGQSTMQLDRRRHEISFLLSPLHR